MDNETLKNFINNISKEHRETGGGARINFEKGRKENILKLSKQVKLLNIKTGEVQLFDSINDTSRYLRELNHPPGGGEGI